MSAVDGALQELFNEPVLVIAAGLDIEEDAEHGELGLVLGLMHDVKL